MEIPVTPSPRAVDHARLAGPGRRGAKSARREPPWRQPRPDRLATASSSSRTRSPRCSPTSTRGCATCGSTRRTGAGSVARPNRSAAGTRARSWARPPGRRSSITWRGRWPARRSPTRRGSTSAPATRATSGWPTSPIATPSGRVRGFVSLVTDISEVQSAERALRESERMLAESQAAAHVGSWEAILNDDGSPRSLRWSDETYRIFGHEPGARRGRPGLFISSVHPDDRALLLRTAERRDRGAATASRRSSASSAPTGPCARSTRGPPSSGTPPVGRRACAAPARTSPSASAPRRRCDGRASTSRSSSTRRPP